MTEADLSSWVGGDILPPEITHPENVQKLRELTTELEMKIERALRSLFTSSVMPWEQWFINAIANPDNRAALGIPNNLEKVDISHLLGGREGFHETFRRTNLERLGIIIAESLRTIVSNPLAGAGLTPFRETIETLSNELLRELRWNEFDNRLKEKTKKLEAISWNDIEQLTYGFWHSYKDPAMNVVLDTLTRARYSRKILIEEEVKTVLDCLTSGYKNSGGVNSCVTLLWLLSVIAFSSDENETLIRFKTVLESFHLPDEKGACDGAHLSGEEPYLCNKKDMVDSLGVLQEFKDKKYIRRVISIPAAIEVYAFLKKKQHDNADVNFGGFILNLEALLRHVLLLDDNEHDGKKPLKESDWGHLYFMCIKLDALYSFWIWYHADLLTHKQQTVHRIGDHWYSDNVFKQVHDIIEQNKSFMKGCPEDPKKENACQEAWGNNVPIKGIQHSVFLMGGAGFGKTELLKQIYKSDKKIGHSEASSTPNTNQENIITLTPLSFVNTRNFYDTIKPPKSKKTFQRTRIVFIDELHIETQPSVYALLLVPLGEGVKNKQSTGEGIVNECDSEYEECALKKNNELNVHFVFASSRYQTKREFLEEAFITKNTAMRDFATRVKHWIELPGFSFIPEQKLALFGDSIAKMDKVAEGETLHAYDPSKLREKDLVQKFLDLSITSTREFFKTKGTDVDIHLWSQNVEERQNSYPLWLWEFMGIKSYG